VRADALTPALSHREREKTGAGLNIVHNRSPLPQGEGENRRRT
jgi:hypothetical protein